VKPNDLKLGETGETITNAGKDLRKLVETRSEFLNKFAADLEINLDNLVQYVDDALLQIVKNRDKFNLIAWFRSKPDNMKVYEVIGQYDGAERFLKQLKASRYSDSVGIICRSFANAYNNMANAAAQQLFYDNRGKAVSHKGHDKKEKKDKKRDKKHKKQSTL
jgi:hypothetical protein